MNRLNDSISALAAETAFAQPPAASAVPLTEAQREIWFAAQMGRSASMAYNECAAVRLKGIIDMSVMRRAAKLLIDRHESLRARFSPEGDFQYIEKVDAIDFPLVDISRSDDEAASLDTVISEHIWQPLDLERGPLWRMCMVRLSESEHILMIVAHHIICDGWSVYLLARELGQIHSALRRGEIPELPPAELFSDYARQQTEEEPSRKHYLNAERYWMQQFAELPPILDLPSNRNRGAERTHLGDQVCIKVPDEVVSNLRRVAKEQNATIFMVLFAAFSTLLHRITQQNDIVIGVPVASQVLAGHERLVGHCANLLPLRSTFAPDQRFSGLLAQTRDTVFEAFDAWSYPFGALLRKLGLSDGTQQVPLANVMFNLASVPDDIRFDGLSVTPEIISKRYVNFDISFNVTDEKGSLQFNCRYSTELFDRSFIERFLGHYVTILSAISRDVDHSVSTIPLVTDHERRQLLGVWNESRVDFPEEQSIEGLIASQVAHHPNAVAIEGSSGTATYHEIDSRADALAVRLRGVGVKPGVLVGLCVDRSPLMVSGLIGILKAGGAYVPLDPTHPRDRNAYILEDSGARLVVTENRWLEHLPEDGPEYLLIDDIHIESEDGSPQTPTVPRWDRAAPDDPAYVIYTSGSTGKPKGVAIPRSAVVNFLLSMLKTPGLSANDVLLAVTTLTFDIAVLELLLPLIAGGRIVMASAEEARDSRLLSQRLESSGATVMQATPTTWRMLIESGWQGSDRFRALCGGEALSRELADAMLSRTGEVWNLYGPTETTVWSAVARVKKRPHPIVIGNPIANTQLHVLDPNLQLLPADVPGELYIGGDGLAIGYHGRPDLTQDRFIRNPFADVASEFPQSGCSPRLYRTGDVAIRRANGDIEILGRTDHQVKIRGHRIELGEIESVLRGRAGIREAVVIVREDLSGNKQLVAYAIGDGSAPINPGEIRSDLKAILPEYMIPSAFVELEQFPLTQNGKIDRKALPAPEPANAVTETDRIAPRNEVESALQAIWAEVLHVDAIGVRDNFFDLGGHSLLATQVLVRIRRTFEVEVPFRRLFDDPTIERLARCIEEERAKDAESAENTEDPGLAESDIREAQ